ncbi:thymidine phosphorylase [Ferroacidibacillus organovorans]|uniref:Pyrimidine-nucleoside phosphorylase n=1 Tax=Ferroacidibacillus organovorans TaxID=1765683 RepID=A0A162T3R6_9BACL|nr:thymidine phosphorylase [Ferroacidibacillus organovorans]KYP80433.1 pyrimidine-nucleoside phosphorylase [Ferroacidibacillus organovorans]OAG94660.1 thymidine phosphorylase [Ferroacidibacillus organovorans]OPG16626.1 thymidine phosphorylase [Ferroacidibacillus organovorans]
MRMVDLIEKKKNSEALSEAEISFIVEGFTHGTIPDYQMAAWLMAVCFAGMNEDETAWLTHEMAHSGDVLDLSMISGPTVDKHSTGGVGDKTTLIVAPLAAALGMYVAKMSGRGLSHTGGTIDKLESIQAFETERTRDAFMEQVSTHGVAVVGQSEGLAPADKKMYALRDVTGTVASLPLIASSIMSKKIASGARHIVLDVKVGDGAFMNTLDDARALAKAMVEIGAKLGRSVCAVLSDMDQPLGRAIGNALEVRESIDVLRGGGPADLRDLSVYLTAKLVQLVEGGTLDDATKRVSHALATGAALKKFKEMVISQGGVWGDDEIYPEMHAAPVVRTITMSSAGYLSSIPARALGTIAMQLGAGREEKTSSIDHRVGLILFKKAGDEVRVGDEFAEIHAATEEDADRAALQLAVWMKTSSHAFAKRPLILDEINAFG